MGPNHLQCTFPWAAPKDCGPPPHLLLCSFTSPARVAAARPGAQNFGGFRIAGELQLTNKANKYCPFQLLLLPCFYGLPVLGPTALEASGFWMGMGHYNYSFGEPKNRARNDTQFIDIFQALHSNIFIATSRDSLDFLTSLMTSNI